MAKRWLFLFLVTLSLAFNESRAEPSDPSSKKQGQDEAMEKMLEGLLGKSLQEVAKILKLEINSCGLIDEPPSILRGVLATYQNGEISLYFSEDDPQFRAVIVPPEIPTCSDLQSSKINGIQYRQSSKAKLISVGPAVPWQFR